MKLEMKKIPLTVLNIFISLSLYAQWDETQSPGKVTTLDNVGIGTSTPNSKLEIKMPGVSVGQTQNIAHFTFGGWNHFENGNGNGTEGKLVFGSEAYSNGIIKRAELSYSTSGTWQRGGALHFYTTPDDESWTPVKRMTIDHSGKVGIGTSTPNSSLEIKMPGVSVGQTQNIAHFTFGGWNHFENDNGNGTEGKLVFGSEAYSNGIIKRAELSYSTSGTWQRGGALHFYTTPDDESWTPIKRMTIDHSGKVGIGTTDFSGDHKLRVEGSIGAREIKVEASGWSDFVFMNDYKLRTLEEVEKHIQEKGHLPEIPSEAEVYENGINLGEMNAKLLQKIEELTLYMIDMNKRVDQLEQENTELKAKNKN